MSALDDMVILHAGEEGKAEYITLYKYISLKGLFGFLYHGDLKITTKDDANDPFEFMPSGVDHNDIKVSTKGFISLSKESDNASMWGNYADKFRGACIEFNVPYFINDETLSTTHRVNYIAEFSKQLSKDDRDIKITAIRTNKETRQGQVILMGDGDFLYNCLYKEKRYNKTQTYSPPPSIPEEYKPIYGEILSIHDAIATKSMDWKHEKEYRFIISKRHATRTEYSDSLMYFSNRITPYASKIILGPLCPHTRKEIRLIYDEAHKKKVLGEMNINKASFTSDSFKLEVSSSNHDDSSASS